MLNRSATGLANRLLSHGVITEDTLDIYVYGFELLLSFLFSTSLIILAGCLMKMALQTFTFLLVFILLRSFSGGYHANTYAKCSIITFSVYGLVIVFASFVRVGLLSYLAIMPVGLVILYVKAPIENPNKELTEQEKSRYRLTSILLFLFFGTAGVCVGMFARTIGAVIWITLVIDLALMFVKTNYERRLP